MLGEEVEPYDINEIQQDGDGVEADIQDVDHPLPAFVVDAPRGETIIEDTGQGDDHDDGQVETHPVDIQRQRLAQVELVEKLLVEQIEQPAADAEGHQGGDDPIDHLHIRPRKPFGNFLFSCFSAHYL